MNKIIKLLKIYKIFENLHYKLLLQNLKLYGKEVNKKK